MPLWVCDLLLQCDISYDGDAGEGFEDDAVAEQGGDVGGVVGRGDFDDVHAEEVGFHADAATASRSREVRPPDSGVPVPGAMPGSTTSTSTERKTPSQSSAAISRASVVEASPDDFGHLEPAHALVGHPLEDGRVGPIASEADLEEAVAADGSAEDEAPHGGAVTPESAVGVSGVGVGVEVDQGDPAEAVVLGDALGGGVGDGVVAAEDDGDGSGLGDLAAGFHDSLEGALAVELLDADVADVDDAELAEGVDLESEVGSVAALGEVVGGADRLRSEAGAGSIAGAGVEGGSEDHRLGAGEGVGLAEAGSGDADEGGVGSVLVGRA